MATAKKYVRYDTLKPHKGKRRLDQVTSNMDETFLMMLSRDDVKSLKMEIEFDAKCEIPYQPKLSGYGKYIDFRDK